MSNIISVQNLTREFSIRTNKNIVTGVFRPNHRQKVAVSNVSFEITKGEAVAFLGPNGAGKTTTTKILTGLVYPTSGNVEVLGYRPQDRKHEYLKQIGLVMGNKAGLNWDLSALQSFDLLRRIYEIDSKVYDKRIHELTKMLKVDHVLDTQIRKLSLGERMKLELIGAILHDPEVIFLDEPTIGLDVTSKRIVRDFLKYVHSLGKTLILTSHDMDDISGVCSRALIINSGAIVYDGSMSSLVDNYDSSRVVKFVLAEPLDEQTKSKIAKLGSIKTLSEVSYEISLDKSLVGKCVEQLSSASELRDLIIESIPLEKVIEDVFNRSGPVVQ
jgi:ABC-2 type transport system ATP-binding protein